MLLLALYGIVIAGLDTIALLFVYALISVLNNAHVNGLVGGLIQQAHLTASERHRTAVLLLAATATLFIVRSVLSVLGLWLTVGAANAAQVELFSRLIRGHASAPQLLRTQRNSSETIRTILSSVNQVTSGIVAGSVALIANLATSVAVAVGLILSSPLVAAAATVYFALIGLAWTQGLRKTLVRRGRRTQELQQELVQLVMQSISASKELQLRGRAHFYADDASARTREINATVRGATVANGSLRYMLETSLVLGAVVVVVVADAVGGSGAALPAVGLVLAGAFRLLPALNQVLFLANQVQFNGPAVDLVESEVRSFAGYADATRVPAVVQPLRFEDELKLGSVTFTYPTRDEPALRDISLTVRPGESCGIVGPTGSGKSTLLDIILGLLVPDSGEIELDGRPMKERRDSWQRSIGYVPQDVYLVDESLRNNVALGWRGSDIDEQAVVDAIRLAGLEEVVADLPLGLDTVVGERGIKLSGGQRQRVGIARALYTHPSVLVLDEATSNLDQTTERRIVDTLAALPSGTTMIVVTHRNASVRRCDHVVYLERGSIRAEGSYAQVSAAVPEFREHHLAGEDGLSGSSAG